MATSMASMTARLKSSFVYLANAVSDLRGNWRTLALVLAPPVLLSSLCVLPDAINLQHQLVRTFEPGLHTVGLLATQTPYRPDAVASPPPVGHWVLLLLHLGIALITLLTNLVALCAIKRMRSGQRAARVLNDTIEVYRDALRLMPPFIWIMLLQLLVIAVGFVLLIVPGLLAMVWLYFSQYALVFDGRRSWPALFHSRDLVRGQFFKVATRIVVFLALWSGYNSWVGGAFFGVSLLIGPIGVWTGKLAVAIFLFNLFAFVVAYATITFFIAAGARLYQDLQAIRDESAAAAAASLPATAPLGDPSL